MKKLTTAFCLLLSLSLFSQKLYTKIKDSKVDKERLTIATNFVNLYLSKCEAQDYTQFEKFVLSKNLENKLFEDRGKSFENLLNKNGKIQIRSFNSAYSHNYFKNADPVEMFVFDISTEKQSELKYISVWVYLDQNVIGGIWFSKEISVNPNKEKDKKESALRSGSNR